MTQKTYHKKCFTFFYKSILKFEVFDPQIGVKKLILLE